MERGSSCTVSPWVASTRLPLTRVPAAQYSPESGVAADQVIWVRGPSGGEPGGEAAVHLSGDYISVYVPTTPNPTSGFFLMVPRADAIALKMSVDEALKYVISMGVVAPLMHEPPVISNVGAKP